MTSMHENLKSNVFDTALIFEGGGMRASYTSALAAVMVDNEVFFDNVYGLSAGSSISVNYVSRDIDRIRRSFVELVQDPEFGGISTFLQHKGYFSAKHIYQETGLPGNFLPFDFETFMENPAKVTIESFQRDTGESVYWTKDDMGTLEDLMVRVRASSSLPLVMPPPVIDGMYYYDGGLGEGSGFLLPKAERDGFARYVIVRTRPREYRKKPPVGLGDKLTGAVLWGRPHVVNALENRWWKYNHLCDAIEKLEADGRAYVFYAEDQSVSSGETDFGKLEKNYEAGFAQAEEEIGAIKAFVGL